MSPLRKLEALMSLSASGHEGFMHGFSGSMAMVSILRWKSSSTQSMIRMIKCGGLASLRTETDSRGHIGSID